VWNIERMIASLPAIVASFGMCSPTWIPATSVETGLKGPRIEPGALGLRSQVSM